jgi:hypothetical protein
MRNLCTGAAVQEQEFNCQKTLLNWDSWCLVGDVSEEQDLFKGVVINVMKKKLAYRFAKMKVRI